MGGPTRGERAPAADERTPGRGPVAPMRIGVRPAEDRDGVAVGRLRSEAFGEAASRKGGRQLLDDLAPAAEARGSDGQLHVTLVAELLADEPAGPLPDGVVMGYAVVVAPPGAAVARLEELYVERDARTIGIGTALLESAERTAAGWGCEGLDSLALPGDRATKNFFEDHGMVTRALVVHRRVDPAADGTAGDGIGDA